jgi:F-type H+-transporting ATPase subunit b
MRRLFFLLTLVIAVAIPSLSTAMAAEEKHGAGSQPSGEAPGHETKAHEAHPQEGPITAKPADQDLALWSLITFLVFVAVLKKFAWSPLISGLNSRESQIKRDIADAESARVQAVKMLAQHQEKLERVQEEVKAILAEARRDADHTKAEIIAVAQKEAEASRHRAVLEIERAKEQALDELFAHMTKNVWTATEQVIGRTLTAGDHERLITEAVTSLSAQKN